MTGGCRFSRDEGRDECIYVQGLGFEEPLRQNRNMIRIYANAIGYALLVFLLLQNVAPHLGVMLLRGFYPAIRIYNGSFLAPGELIETVNIFSALVCYGAALLLLAAVLRIPARAAFPAGRVPAGVSAGCVGLVLASSAIGSGVSALIGLLFSAAGLSPSGPSILPADTPAMLALTVVSTALLPAVCEELLFRGIILQSLRRFGDVFALFTTTLVFALLHRNLVQLPNALLTGLVLGFLMLRTQSLRAVVLCHFVNNAAPIVLQALTAPLSDGAQGAAFMGLSALYLLAGVASLLYFCAARPSFFRPLRGDGRGERYKYRSFFSSVPMALLLAALAALIVMNLFAPA